LAFFRSGISDTLPGLPLAFWEVFGPFFVICLARLCPALVKFAAFFGNFSAPLFW